MGRGWVILILVGTAGLAWIILRTIGAKSESLALSCLQNHLHRLGIPPNAFSEGCLRKVARAVVRMSGVAKIIEKKGPANSHVDDQARRFADDIYALVYGDGLYAAEQIKRYGSNNFLWRIFANHHPETFSIENLEITQSANRIVRERSGDSAFLHGGVVRTPGK